jgi:hypothetical protein
VFLWQALPGKLRDGLCRDQPLHCYFAAIGIRILDDVELFLGSAERGYRQE